MEKATAIARYEYVLYLREKGMTQSMIGDKLGISGCRVGQLLKKYERLKTEFLKPIAYVQEIGMLKSITEN